uniref:F-box domain-containing protein n=1 Tax=Ditylenchus dipsaci TaxID=166011 RepID=A0A915E573_9BILA
MLNIDILAETFKYLSRKELAFIQTTNQSYNTLIETFTNPLHVIHLIKFQHHICPIHQGQQDKKNSSGRIQKTNFAEKHGPIGFSFSEPLDDFLVWAKAPAYLRFRHVRVTPMDGYDKHYLDGITHLKSAFKDAQLFIRMDQANCKHEDELLQKFKDFLIIIAPAFELVSGCTLWCFAFEESYEPLPPAPYGNQEDILSIPLIRNCCSLELLVQRYVDRLGIATYDQICDWLEAEANFTRHLQLRTNQHHKHVVAIIQLLRKRFTHAEKPCSFVLETPWMSDCKYVPLEFLTPLKNKNTSEELVLEPDLNLFQGMSYPLLFIRRDVDY